MELSYEVKGEKNTDIKGILEADAYYLLTIINF